MKSGFFQRILFVVSMSAALFACRQSGYGPSGMTQIHFELAVDVLTRAPQEVDFGKYSVRLYVFKAGETSSPCSKIMDITGSSFTVDGLERNTVYRCVFLAIPKGQLPSLPADATYYETAVMQYLDGNQPDQEVFRNTLTFSTADDITSYSIVLTRQNGAVQIRMGNADGSVSQVTLEAEGLPDMLFQDATGGKVLSSGEPVQLSKSDNPAVSDDFRISINLLPTEDLTGKGRLKLKFVDGTEQVYELKSTSGTIPVYPDQITWLVLRGTGEGGSFEVGFGNDIDLDDDEWDGYFKQ